MTLITNDREAFEFVRNHLLTQNEKSIADNSECLYRGYSEATIEELKVKAGEIVETEGIEWEADKDQVFYDLLADVEAESMCAVGCLIMDKFYDSEMEGKTVEPDEWVWEAVVKSNPVWKLTDSSLEMLKKLQSIHDGTYPRQWEVELSLVDNNFDQYGDYKKRWNKTEEQ
jgi:hypothetical protein